VDRVGFEPTHPKEQIYSLPPLSHLAAYPEFILFYEMKNKHSLQQNKLIFIYWHPVGELNPYLKIESLPS
jgi:hypothetical protein